jgi:DNA topoisomerase-2
VDFVVTFPKGRVAELESTVDSNGCNGLEKILKLFTTVSTTNMHMFNADCKLHKYGSVQEIIDEFYTVRLCMYNKRKAALLVEMEKKLVKLSNKARYIQETLKGSVDLRRKTAAQVEELLVSQSFVKLDGDFKYLVKMPMDSVTDENVATIMREKEQTETELDQLKKTTLEAMWQAELATLERQYDIYKTKRECIAGAVAATKVKVVAKKLKVTKK